MSTLKYKHKLGLKATCRVTNFSGTLIAVRQGINGAITYGVQPASKKDENWVQDAKNIDEDDLVPNRVSEEQEAIFKFSCGQKVQNIVNGFEGIVISRMFWKNGCTMYVVEGKCITTDEGVTTPSKSSWEQELELIKDSDKKISAPTKKRGGPITTLCAVPDFPTGH